MNIEFVKLSPTQNMTLLVTSKVARADQARIAERLMAYDSVNAEQVGFLEPASLTGARARLQMMGGEFCGNAAMSLAAFFAFRDGLPDGAEAEYALEISGSTTLVPCKTVRRRTSYIGRVSMPLPKEVRKISLESGHTVPVVFFEGIAHAIVDEKWMRPDMAENRIAEWCERLDTEACGILLTDELRSHIQPLVYVRATHSAVWERGCGSGSAAIAALMAHESRGNICREIFQPGGKIGVEVETKGGRASRIFISGAVRIAACGTAFLD